MLISSMSILSSQLGRIRKSCVGDIQDLPFLDNEACDSVLRLAGPLSQIEGTGNRGRAIRELAGVPKGIGANRKNVDIPARKDQVARKNLLDAHEHMAADPGIAGMSAQMHAICAKME